MTPELIKLVCNGKPLKNLEALDESSQVVELLLIVDDTPLYTWDIEGNPDKEHLSARGAVVTMVHTDNCWTMDYVNVLSQFPVRQGVHFVEFHMRRLQDEQWCGVTMFKDRAGSQGGDVPGCFYYSGRRAASSGHLDAFYERKHRRPLPHVQSGDVIGLLLDADRHAALFSLNGQFHGGCRLPALPMLPGSMKTDMSYF